MIWNQVNNSLCKRNLLYSLRRYLQYDRTQSNLNLHPLTRKLLRVSGGEASVFLQGLITNDMRHFEEGAKSMYTMFLNNKGRVLYETLIHKHTEPDTFLIECDQSVISLLQKHLKIFKLKRKIDIHDINKELRLWALITPVEYVPDLKITSDDISVYKDPRLADLGYRVIAPTSLEGSAVAKKFGEDLSVFNTDDEYKYLRYQLGVSEGVSDIPPASSFPLEINCDYLHGVSFHKGCYIGQEVTARVHHTGVVRKRIMPLQFTENINESFEKDAVVSASDNIKSNLGKLKGSIRDYGLALVRIKEALETKSLTVGKHSVKVIKPSWWPIEAPKDKINVKSD